MKSRTSFAIYFYTHARPSAEPAPSHGAVYVRPAPPKDFKPNVMVMKELYDANKDHLRRQHSYLPQLDKRVYKLSNVIGHLTRYLPERKRASTRP